MVFILALLGAFIALFLLTIVLAKRPFCTADIFLALWLTGQGGAFAAISLSDAFPTFNPLFVLSVGQFLLFALGPIQLLYARSTLGTPLHLKHQGIILALVAFILGVFPTLIELEAQSGALVVMQAPIWLLLLPPAALILSALWPLAVLRLAQEARRGIKDNYSNISNIDPGWMEVWAASSLVVTGLSLTAHLNSLIQVLPLNLHVAALLTVQLVQLAYVAHRGLTRPGIFQGSARIQTSSARRVDRKSAIADFEQVKVHLTNTRLFLADDLTAPILADSLGWAPERLTTAFREGGQTNFHDAVFQARIMEMERLVRDPKNSVVTTLALGLDAGFGSKSAMYDAFRRELGLSPAAWRRTITHP